MFSKSYSTTNPDHTAEDDVKNKVLSYHEFMISNHGYSMHLEGLFFMLDKALQQIDQDIESHRKSMLGLIEKKADVANVLKDILGKHA
jgi:hypothetical protein